MVPVPCPAVRAMIRVGLNEIDGVPVEVVRPRARRINIRIRADGTVRLAVPRFWTTLAQGERFLRDKWAWVAKTRGEVLARLATVRAPITEADLVRLAGTLDELNVFWASRLGEAGVAWKIRRVKSLWGCCHWRKRYITYNAELAHAPRALVEYVVVHEYTHFAVHDHGPRFRALMDVRLPGWRLLRRQLNRRAWNDLPQAGPPAGCELA